MLWGKMVIMLFDLVFRVVSSLFSRDNHYPPFFFTEGNDVCTRSADFVANTDIGKLGTAVPDGYDGGGPLYPVNDATFVTPAEDSHQIQCEAGVDPGLVQIQHLSECKLDSQYFEFKPHHKKWKAQNQCLIRCPYPVYTTSELRIMWAFYVLPVLVSFPLNTLIVCTKFIAKHRKTRDSLHPVS
jgi:hypothetical protein